nr:GNAT family N-acetyltransferase [Saprospiraceae bacterium]
MRIFYSEFNPYYESYSFPYGVYAVPENREDITEVYESGFLPFTGDLRLKESVFYKARSLRVNLEKFEDGSENRRTAGKFEGLNIVLKPLLKNPIENPDFRSFAMEYTDKRFKGGSMDENRLSYVLSRSYLSNTYLFSLDKKPIAYLLAVENSDVFHYWFCFFDLSLSKQLPLGKFLMHRGIQLAMSKGCRHIYLGTCYGTHSLYKARDFKGVEFHDGNRWVNDLKLLKKKCAADSEENFRKLDQFKSAKDPNQFIELIINHHRKK